MSYIIFTDGSSRGNPGPGGWGAIIAVSDSRIQNLKSEITELGGREGDTTNNRMEMLASIEALKTVPDGADVELHTDSAYLINGITKWVWAWQKNNWQTKTKDDVLNVDLWQELVSVSKSKKIKWIRISGHSGVPANERCDVIATSFADSKAIKLFHGLVTDYGIDMSVTQVESEKSKVKSENKERKKSKAYSYVSMVDGKIETHETWGECEARVKGKSGARFKKSVSREDEQAIIAQFEALR